MIQPMDHTMFSFSAGRADFMISVTFFPLLYRECGFVH